MAGDTVQATVKILDREYQIACREDERDGLMAAAEMVNDRMKAVRGRGNVIGTDRVAVMTALNMAHELLGLQETQQTCQRVCERVEALQGRVGEALGEDRDGSA
jgi:cell division protein ZapA